MSICRRFGAAVPRADHREPIPGDDGARPALAHGAATGLRQPALRPATRRSVRRGATQIEVDVTPRRGGGMPQPPPQGLWLPASRRRIRLCGQTGYSNPGPCMSAKRVSKGAPAERSWSHPGISPWASCDLTCSPGSLHLSVGVQAGLIREQRYGKDPNYGRADHRQAA